MKNLTKILGIIGAFASMLVLSGCEIAVLNPAGEVAMHERNLIVIATVVMLCVVVPVMIAIVYFAIKYRATNTDAEYLPDWGFSHKIETIMWGVPICIVVILAIMTAYYTHKYEPSKPLSPEVVGEQEALQVDVVALEWKWLFIYPEYGVASVNELYAPAGRQVFLQLTAEDSINAFWVPTLGTVLYAMPQMNAKLHLFTKNEGVFSGTSANYSGDGFAGMHFKWHSVSNGEFDNWVAKARESGRVLDRAAYVELTKRTKNVPVSYYSQVENDLYYRVVNRCVRKDGDGNDTQCNEKLMAIAAAKSLWGELCSVVEPKVVEKYRETGQIN